jgi:ATP/maltotriose-dependent transcriptional regulator MalT
VTRHRLHAVLDRADGAQLVQVVAPFGAGKTTLVADWCHGRAGRWLSADRHDRLVAEVLDERRPGTRTTTDDEALGLLREVRPEADPVVVVLDDAHLATRRTRRLLGRLLVQAPHAARVVLLGRRELTVPELPARLRAATLVLRGEDLAFDDDEAEDLVRAWAPALADDGVARVVDRSTGWAAALVLGALAATSADDPAWDALAEQTLSTLPPRTRALLVSTCDEGVFDGATAGALSGDPEAAGLLDELTRDGLLVTGDASGWTQHPVLREGLRRRAASDPATYKRLVDAHRRASETLRDPAEAVRHATVAATRSRQADGLAQVLRTSGQRLLIHTQQARLRDALEVLPRAARDTDPALLVLESMLCRLTSRYDEAARLAADAEHALDGLPAADRDEQVQDLVALMTLWRSRCGWADPHAAIERAAERLGCHHEARDGRPDGHPLRAGQSLEWASWLMGELATVQVAVGRLDEADRHLQEAVYHGRMLGNAQMTAAGLAHRSFLELVDASFQTAAATARSALDLLADQPPPSLPFVARAHVVLGWAAVHELDLITAHEQLAAAEAASAQEVDPLVTEMTHLLEARLLAEEGLVADARRLLAERTGTLTTTPRFLARLRAIVEAQTAALANDVATLRDQVSVLAELGYPLDARLFAAVAQGGDGRPDLALLEVEALLAGSRLDPAVGAGAAALRLGLLLRAGQRDRAAELLPDLLARVAPQRMLQVLTIGFLGGRSFAELLEEEAARDDAHPFAAEALTCIGRYARPFPDTGARRVRPVSDALGRPQPEPADTGVSPLTRREHDVLAELSLGGSYADVADALFVSENTVKTHLSSVYRKLGVDRRVDALRIAREHHLL